MNYEEIWVFLVVTFGIVAFASFVIWLCCGEKLARKWFYDSLAAFIIFGVLAAGGAK